MVKKLNGKGSLAMLFEIYTYLNNKKRTPSENVIYEMINDQYKSTFETSPTYYYRLYKDKAKVNKSTFTGRVKRGWSLEKALTTERLSYGATSLKSVEKMNGTEKDIIRFIENKLPLNPRQLKYIESNPAFAEKLKNRKVEC
ncbi:hypothetical protein [Mammaliicoccus sp. N-M50]|uniref:hypothetical protein n=1 Tax=Mammaliicoccus sp. N-M50 TaxID=2898709 RepID=UPI001EFB32D7|nr:hypothetical protein [Mammaliicoccus sp. N-M50]